MFARISGILLLLGLYVSASAQSSTYFKSSDNLYHIYLPGGWTKQASTKGMPLSLQPPDSKKTDFPTALTLETGSLAAGYEKAGIREIAKAEEAIMKQQFGQTLTITSNEFRIINNKEWWHFVFSVKASKKLSYRFNIFKTIHNQVTYTLSYRGEEGEYYANQQPAINAIWSFMFYTSDDTEYKDSQGAIDNATALRQLQPFSGTYVFFIEDNSGRVKQTITIGDSAQGKYKAMERREIFRNGKNNLFEAALRPESIEGDVITLSTDAVSIFDNTLNLRKASYKLQKNSEGFAAVMWARDSTFKSMDMVFVKQKSPVQTKAQVVPATAGVKNEVDGLGVIKDPMTAADEADNLKRFGNGKVSRALPNELKLVTSGNKTVSLKDDGSTSYKFLGSVKELNSYVIQRLEEEDVLSYIVVNKTTGAVSDLPALDYRLSPDKKWMVVYNNALSAQDLESASFIRILSVSDAGIKESYEVTTAEPGSKKGWAPASVKWAGNSSIEVEKEAIVSGKKGAAGKTSLNFNNGKWVMAAAQQQPVPGATLVPSVTDRVMKGGKTPDELGRILLAAMKSNDVKTWYACIMEGSLEEVTASFKKVREHFTTQGLSDWSKVQFSRVTYSKDSYNTDPERSIFTFYNIEFTYEKDFIGLLKGSVNSARIELIGGKYYLLRGLNDGGMMRKGQYNR
ncbi:hypothetical protein LZZ85_12370 [Terrimonas sp. NA20]|uniref:Uncharacterized protein n=1 Tax=Terrimonas ginsenosidimutans TaxID=2908004 RepID=A0ABS9KRY8_9BACT|nr:hypothetical protein [Terrimonas ginsenosidimutans]MCG2615085.1 hypothetical protein [Terrimonas ginsenosidimutans]